MKINFFAGLSYSIVNETEAISRLASNNSGVVLINHQSSIDLLALITQLWPLMEGRCSVISKKSLLYTGPFGLMAYMSGVSFIDRNKSKEARQVLNESTQECKDKGLKMVVFPEGTRFHHPTNLTMLPFKLGAFDAAINSKLSVLPVVLSHYNFYDAQRKILNPGGIRIHVLEPIDSRQFPDSKTFSEFTREKMIKVFQDDAKTHYS